MNRDALKFHNTDMAYTFIGYRPDPPRHIMLIIIGLHINADVSTTGEGRLPEKTHPQELALQHHIPSLMRLLMHWESAK